MYYKNSRGERNWYRCICTDAVGKNPSTFRSTSAEVETEIKMWLKRAPSRQGGRTRRVEAAVDGDRRSVDWSVQDENLWSWGWGGLWPPTPPVTHLSCKALSLTVVDAVLLSVEFPLVHFNRGRCSLLSDLWVVVIADNTQLINLDESATALILRRFSDFCWWNVAAFTDRWSAV
jgi:hypothetical protein